MKTNTKRAWLSGYTGKRNGPNGIMVCAAYSTSASTFLEEIKPRNLSSELPPAFDWGSAGAAANNLAKHILLHYFDVLETMTEQEAKVGMHPAAVLDRAFRVAFIEPLPDQWSIDVEVIEKWLDRPEIRRRIKELFGIQLYSERAEEA